MPTTLTPESPRRRVDRYVEAARSYARALRALDEAERLIRRSRADEPHPFPPDATTELALALARKALVADLAMAERYVAAAERYADAPDADSPGRPASRGRGGVGAS